MNCPNCGSSFKPQSMGSNPVESTIQNVMKKGGDMGSKLKGLRPTRVRPDALKHAALTRGGRYSST